MRTTITLESDVASLLREFMQRDGLSFKQAVNEAVRKGLLGRRDVPAFRQKTMRLGRPLVDLTKALALADELDDLDHGKAAR
jgi:hypothetical protein